LTIHKILFKLKILLYYTTGLFRGGNTIKSKNPIVIIILVGLAIIAAVAAYTFLKPEPEPKVHAATYGYYFQESRVGELQFTSVDTGTYQFEGEFNIDITIGEVGASFDGEVGDFRNSVPQSKSSGGSYEDSSLPFPTAIDAAIFVDVTREMTFLLPPERWGDIDVGYSEQFTSMIPLGGIPELTVEMITIGKEDVVVPSGTYGNCFVVNGTQPEMDLEITLWVTEQGIVPQAEITMAVRGVDPLTLTMKLQKIMSSRIIEFLNSIPKTGATHLTVVKS
jgi:hypothetical protein